MSAAPETRAKGELTTSVSALVGIRLTDAEGKPCGRVQEFAVDVEKDAAHVAALVVRKREGSVRTEWLLPVQALASPVNGAATLRACERLREAGDAGHFLLLERDLLDQQIIDVGGRKVVRVNDVELQWETGEHGLALRIASVEVGLRGAARRLLKGLPAAFVDGFASRIKPRSIPWDFVDLIDRDPARRVKLKIEQERLAGLHPADIAAILEELAPAERGAIFTSLPEETAAETLEEFDPRVQRELVEALDDERAADIIEEMDPAAAADLLNELSEERSDAILEEMEPEERHDVEELLDHNENSAAGRMTTDYVAVQATATVAAVVGALRDFEGDPDTITEVYLLDERQHLKSVVGLLRLLMADPATQAATLAEGHCVSCGLRTTVNEVAELFDKYNLRSLPVLDEAGCIAGAIHAEQVIAQLRED